MAGDDFPQSNHDFQGWVNSEVVMKFTQIDHQITIIFPLLLVYSLLTTINHHY